MNQLNFFLFDKKRLREALYSRIAPLFPGSVIIYNTIDKNIEEGFKLKDILEKFKTDDFCEECIEPCCCTKSDPVHLYPEDMEKIDALGYKDYSKTYIDALGREQRSIKNLLPCQFLKDKRCTIYSHRPYVCRRYPLHEEGKTNKKVFNIADNCNIAFNVLKSQIVTDLNGKTD
jgi:Fe-S-cluster containining protein